MRTSAPMRAGRRPVKRLDLSAMREVLRDQRTWCAIGTVIQPDGEANASHWEAVSDDGGGTTDIMIEVVLAPANIEVTARLQMSGVIQVPAVGDEVVIVFPDGQVDWMPVIVARLSSGSVPNPGGGQAPAPGTIVICPGVGGTVLVHDGSGGAEPLVRRSEFVAHTHKVPALTAGDQSYVVGVAAGPDTGAPADITGTTVLRSR